jgi:hypothetical protein
MKENCNLCGLPGHLTTGVVQGKFGAYCKHCIQGSKRMANPGHAQYSRARDREDHLKDMIQPRDFNGRPNREFIHAYPTESKQMFNEKELRENG